MRTFHFMRYKWWFIAVLIAVFIFSAIAIFIVGLEFGIDFRGGVRLTISLEESATVDDIRTIVSSLDVQNPIIQSVSAASTATSFLITAQDMPKEQQDKIVAALGEKYGVTEGSVSAEEVGASFGRETTNRALIAVAIALLAIIAYMSVRFEFKFAIPAIVALVHDVAFTLGVYAVGNRLVTSATVAAILTILGYSVHDTIVVYDRMRENTSFMKKETYGDMIDLSISQTLVRSINTSIAVVLPLLAILIFGGPTLKDFALALTVGTVIGTYSSLFVAAPLVLLWKEREPRYRKRLLAASAGGQIADISDSSFDNDRKTGGKTKSVDDVAPPPRAGQKPVQSKTSQSSNKNKTSKKRPPTKRK